MIEGTTSPDAPQPPPGALSCFQSLLDRPGLRHLLVMFVATSLANLLDYGYSVAMGRMLSAEGYGVLVALSAVLQIASVSLVVIRTVVARATVELSVGQQATGLSVFARGALRRTGLWGGAAVFLVGALSGHIAR